MSVTVQKKLFPAIERTPMKRTELAESLGISGSMVSKLCKRGMPDHSVEAAMRWRKRHLEPGRVKPPPPGAAPLPPPPGLQPGARKRLKEGEAPLARLNKLASFPPQDWPCLVGTLRELLQQLRPDELVAVQIPSELWPHLVGADRWGAIEQLDAMGDPSDAVWRAALAAGLPLPGGMA